MLDYSTLFEARKSPTGGWKRIENEFFPGGEGGTGLSCAVLLLYSIDAMKASLPPPALFPILPKSRIFSIFALYKEAKLR